MSVELKPCPFCGSTAQTAIACRDQLFGGEEWQAHCDQCGAEVSLFYHSEDEAAEAWNSRAEETA